jgi:nitrite reductase (NADH) small subunit
MYKQVFDLRTGACLDPVGKEPVDLLSYPVEVRDGVVLVSPRPAPLGPVT